MTTVTKTVRQQLCEFALGRKGKIVASCDDLALQFGCTATAVRNVLSGWFACGAAERLSAPSGRGHVLTWIVRDRQHIKDMGKRAPWDRVVKAGES